MEFNDYFKHLIDIMYEGQKKNNPKNKFFFKGNKTIYYDKDGERYVVKCCEDDVYDKKVGMLYVLAKAQGIDLREIDELIEEPKKDKKSDISDIKIGDVFVCHTSFTSYSIDYSRGDKIIIQDYYGQDCFTIKTTRYKGLIINKYDLLKNAYKE